MKRLVLFFMTLIVPSGVYAHDMWLERQGEGYALFYGHRGGETLVIDAKKIRSISISASLKRPVSSKDADAEIFEATLTFEVSK